MSDTPPASPPPMPQAHVRARTGKGGRISAIWIIPLIAIAVAGWLAWRTISQKGPVITITFQSAEGLEAGKSHVRHKDVDLGLVQSVALSPDLSRVIVTIQMNREADPMLTDKAMFWVVRPRLFAGSVSGLSTLVSGSYIELLPASEGGKPERNFTGREEPPVLEPNTPGRTFLLDADRLGSISLGAPVFYRDLTVGTVLGWDLKDMARRVTIHVFVRAPFDQYVTDRSRFWDASGVSVKLGAEGIQLQLESLRAVLLGGVAFETPDEATGDPPSAANRDFRLYRSHDAALSAGYTRRFSLKSYFDGSVRGLAIGAPVEIHGIRIGQVTGIDLTFNPQTGDVRVPVTYEIEPDRLNREGRAASTDPIATMRALVARGLRAKLDSANIVTGQLVVGLEFKSDADPAEMGVEGGVPVIPAVASDFASITNSVTAILRKVNQMPFEQIGRNLNETLRGASDFANGKELKQALESLASALVSVQHLVQEADKDLGPVLRKLPAVLTTFQDAIARVGRLSGSLDAGYGDGSKFRRDLDRLLEQVNDAARSVRVLTDLLARHPEALIRGRAGAGTEPKP